MIPGTVTADGQHTNYEGTKYTSAGAEAMLSRYFPLHTQKSL